MTKSKLVLAAALLICSILSLSSCDYTDVAGDEEVVLEMQPAIFGHGGVQEEPVTPGSIITAVSTKAHHFKTIPITYTEAFNDMMTSDNTPVNFSAYVKIAVQKGHSPLLYSNFGKDWYKNSIQPSFRTFVRDEASKYKMFSLTSDRNVSVAVQQAVYKMTKFYVQELHMPVNVLEVQVGAVKPPDEVLEETRRTAAQNQGKLTQDARASQELARKQAESNKAIADNAYRVGAGMSIEQYLVLRGLEIEKEKVEMVRDKQNVNIIMGDRVQPMYNVK